METKEDVLFRLMCSEDHLRDAIEEELNHEQGNNDD